jgi:hypothetical protein
MDENFKLQLYISQARRKGESEDRSQHARRGLHRLHALTARSSTGITASSSLFLIGTLRRSIARHDP